MRHAAVTLLVSCLLALGGLASAETFADEEALASLALAVERHPDDPDLAWLHARALVEAGRDDEAVTALERLLARWPERRAAAPLLLGRLLAERGQHAEALTQLYQALSLDPASAPAHFHLGLSLRALGRDAEADRHLAAAAHAEPALRSESLLLRALSRMERGDETGANALLRETIELAPDSAAAESARLLLGERAPRPARRRLQVDAYAGMEYDSNVTLDSGDVAGLNSNRSDAAGVWGTSISGEVYQGERAALTLGARYDARRYLDLRDYDTDDLLAFFSARVHSHERFSWRLDGLFGQGFLDDAPYLRRTLVRPNVLVVLGERAGVLRLHVDAEALWFEEGPLFSSLERDGYSFGTGLEHYLLLPGLPESWVAWSLGYSHRLTDSESDLLGFDGDYDHDRVGGGIRTRLALPLSLRLEAHVGAFGELYRNDNLVDFLSTRALQGLRARKRRDVLLETSMRIVRPVTSWLDLELSWRFLDRFSNTDVYAYERHVVGVRFRVHGL